MNFKFNGGRGAYLCDRCNTMICAGLGPEDPITAARVVHATSALVTPDKRFYCSFKCMDKHTRVGRVVAEYAFRQDVAAMNELERQLVAEHYVPIQFMSIPDWVSTKVVCTCAAVDVGENAFDILFQNPSKPSKELQIWTPLWVAIVHDAGHEFFAEGSHARGFGPRFEHVLELFRNDKEARSALLTAYQLGGFRATRRVLFPKYENA